MQTYALEAYISKSRGRHKTKSSLKIGYLIRINRLKIGNHVNEFKMYSETQN